MKRHFPLALAGFIAFLVFSASIKSYAVTQVVNVQNFSFSPSSFTINAGDTVKWVRINGTHTTTSVTVPGGAATWDSNLNSNTTSFTYVPAVAGSYTYKCVPHETMNMTGGFTVTCPSPTVMISAGGPTTFCKPSSVTLSPSATFESYQWNRNNSPLPGSTTSTLVVKSSGNYSLAVTNGCGATATSNSISVTANAQPGAGFVQSPCSNGAVNLARTGSPASGVTFQWKLDNMNISGATNSTYSATMSGSYRVQVTITATGCKRTSQPQTVTVSCKEGQSELSRGITVFPNPSTENFTFSTSVIDEAGEVEIRDLSGATVETLFFNAGEDVTGNRDLAAGVYVATVRVRGEALLTFKLIKTE